MSKPLRSYRIQIVGWDHKVLFEGYTLAREPKRTKLYKQAHAMWQSQDTAYMLRVERVETFIP
jgi:hypothetical protein